MGDIMNNDRGRLTIPEVSAEGVKISQEDGLDYLIHEHTSKSKYDELTRQDDPANDASLDDLTLDEICSMTSEERKSKWLEKQETIKQAREQEVNSEKNERHHPKRRIGGSDPTRTLGSAGKGGLREDLKILRYRSYWFRFQTLGYRR